MKQQPTTAALAASAVLCGQSMHEFRAWMPPHDGEEAMWARIEADEAARSAAAAQRAATLAKGNRKDRRIAAAAMRRARRDAARRMK